MTSPLIVSTGLVQHEEEKIEIRLNRQKIQLYGQRDDLLKKKMETLKKNGSQEEITEVMEQRIKILEGIRAKLGENGELTTRANIMQNEQRVSRIMLDNRNINMAWGSNHQSGENP